MVTFVQKVYNIKVEIDILISSILNCGYEIVGIRDLKK